jgi:ubiquinone biosynthesis protein
VISIESTAKQLDPEFNLAEVAGPFIREVEWERWNPVNVIRNSVSEIGSRLHLLGELPADLQRFLYRLEDEDVRINLQHRGLDELGETIHQSFSRLALAFIVGSLFVGSSIVISTGVKPHLWGYPAWGIVGYALSLAMGVLFIFDMIRHSGFGGRGQKGASECRRSFGGSDEW